MKNICLKNQCNLGNRGLFWVPCVSHYRQLKCDFFSKLACTSRPITDHLPYLSYNWKYSKDYGGCQLTTNCVTPSDLGELEIDGLVGLIGDSFQFLLSRYLCLQFYCNCWYCGHVILGSREILWRGQNCWCHLWNLLWLAKKA